MEREEKQSGPTALAVTLQALGCPAGTSSGTPNALAVESVTLAQGPKEDPESKNETGQDKDPEGHNEEDPNNKAEREKKQSVCQTDQGNRKISESGQTRPVLR